LVVISTVYVVANTCRTPKVGTLVSRQNRRCRDHNRRSSALATLAKVGDPGRGERGSSSQVVSIEFNLQFQRSAVRDYIAGGKGRARIHRIPQGPTFVRWARAPETAVRCYGKWSTARRPAAFGTGFAWRVAQGRRSGPARRVGPTAPFETRIDTKETEKENRVGVSAGPVRGWVRKRAGGWGPRPEGSMSPRAKSSSSNRFAGRPSAKPNRRAVKRTAS